MNTMELPPQNTEVEAPEEEVIDYEAIRKELIKHQTQEQAKDLPTGHLLDVELDLVSEEELLFWKNSRDLADKVKDVYKNPETCSEFEFWLLHDAVRDLEKQWTTTYHHRQGLTTGEGRFVAFMANSFVLATGYMSLIEKHRNHEAVEQLAQFKQAQSDPEAEHRTAYLAETRIEDLLESDLHTYQLLQTVESHEKTLAEMGLLDQARAYAEEFDTQVIAELKLEDQKLIEEYASLSLRLRRMWESWHDVQKLSASRYDFYNYIGNRVHVIAGNQELG